MNRVRQNLLSVVVLLGVAAIGAEIGLLQRARTEAGRARAALEQKKQERDGLARQFPLPTEENEAAVAADLAAVRRRLDGLREGLQPGPDDPLGKPTAGKSTDAFFELAGMVERARAQASALRVTLRPDECFGFAAYANEGPAAGLLGPVGRQQRAVQSLLEPLFESRPLTLLGVRRVAPSGVGSDGGRGADDFFALDAGLSLRQAGLIETEPVRLEFTGQTSTLRAFLAGIASLRQPAIVRSVDVEPLPAESGFHPAVADASQPVVRQRLSKFAVTVEFVLLASASASPAP
jgi:hypothetical protein